MKTFKKYILIAAATILTTSVSFAQDDNNVNQSSDLEQRISNLEAENAKLQAEAQAQENADLRKYIWGKGRYTRLGFAWAQTAPENSAVYKGKFGVSLTKGVTYRILPTKPIAGCLMFGIDATWFDLQVASYKSPYENVGGNWTSDFVEDGSSNDDEGGFDFNIGHLSLSAAIGVGPSVTVAPFVFTGIKGLMPPQSAALFPLQPDLYGLYGKPGWRHGVFRSFRQYVQLRRQYHLPLDRSGR